MVVHEFVLKKKKNYNKKKHEYKTLPVCNQHFQHILAKHILIYIHKYI